MSSTEKIQLLVSHRDRQLDCFLRLVEILGSAGAPGGFPRVVIRFEERHLAELRLAEPVDVPLVGALPGRLLLFLFQTSASTVFQCSRIQFLRPSASPESINNSNFL